MSLRLIALACFIPSCINAQRPDTANIPRELAVALVMMSDYSARREPTIVVGRVPDQSLARFVPSRARVLGGVTLGGDRGRVTTIFALPESPDSALTVVASHLEASGLKAPPAFENMPGGGGFVATSIGPPGRPTLSHCGDSLSTYTTVAAARAGGSLVSLTVTRSLRNTVCDREMRSRMTRGFEDDMLELPTLRPPPGATGGRAGSGGGGDTRQAHAEYQSSLTVVQMLDHFVPQLKEQGWTMLNRVSDGELSLQTATRTKDGQPVHLMLTDARFDRRTHTLTVRVWRESRDP